MFILSARKFEKRKWQRNDGLTEIDVKKDLSQSYCKECNDSNKTNQ